MFSESICDSLDAQETDEIATTNAAAISNVLCLKVNKDYFCVLTVVLTFMPLQTTV